MQTCCIEISNSQRGILETLLYFDIFKYPLTKSEIQQFSSFQIDTESIEELASTGCLIEENGFYYLAISDIDVEERIRGNKRAQKLMSKAKKQTQFIGSFPFVRSVSVSGSMSKGYLAEDADLDFFIITEPGRLWLARTLLILYKKIFLLNSRKYFCVNYFVDTNHLEIEEHNRFTATEIVTLQNGYGAKVHDYFLAANKWVTAYYPFADKKRLEQVNESGIAKQFLERVFSGKFGDWIDAYFMKITLAKWQSSFGGMDAPDFELAFKSRKYVSKHHPRNYQKIVLAEIEKRKQLLTEKFGIAW